MSSGPISFSLSSRRHGARTGGGGLRALHELRQAKIHQVDIAIRRDLDVARLDIPMEDGWLARVQVAQRVAHGGAHHHGILLRDGAHALHALAQIFPLDKVHDQVLPLVADREMIRHARQVRVAQARQDHRLEPELASIFVCRKEVFLDGYVDTQILVHGAINRSHAALTENLNNAIAFMKKSAALQRHLKLIPIQSFVLITYVPEHSPSPRKSRELQLCRLHACRCDYIRLEFPAFSPANLI